MLRVVNITRIVHVLWTINFTEQVQHQDIHRTV